MAKGAHTKSSAFRTIVEIVIIIAIAVGLATLFTRFIMQPYEIPSGSMEETIEVGDRVFSEKIGYVFNEPQPGDIITFSDPSDPERILIKRVIATGGQTVDLRDGKVYVDGVELDEPYTLGKPSLDLNSGISYPYTVPADHVWVMGDNRTNSADSRVFGAVPVDSITGRAIFRYWPLERIGTL